MKKTMAMLALFATCSAHACSIHQLGLSFSAPTGTYAVLANVLKARERSVLQGVVPAQHTLTWLFSTHLSSQTEHEVDFIIYEAVSGHLSQVLVGDSVNLVPYSDEQLPGTSELMLITEWDVIFALVNKHVSWRQATAYGWVRVTGSAEQVERFNQWMTDVFDGIG
ncbi:hypothetical protein [Vibrio sp. WXL103]|uniref:hypothetical protein n=1 Tax=Vibrio sp. WXL103 TaxID=3450710 RepID=UPI003EC66170